jgi:hypothetical protein
MFSIILFVDVRLAPHKELLVDVLSSSIGKASGTILVRFMNANRLFRIFRVFYYPR